MKTKILLLVVTAAMLASYAGAAMSQTSPGGTLDANSLPEATSLAEVVDQGVLNANFPAKAQTFTATTSGALTSAQIQMYKECDAASDVRMQIATVDESGLPTDDILAETTLPASAFDTEPYPSVGDLVTVTFSDPAQVEAGQKYAFVFSLESPTGDCGIHGFHYHQPLKGDVYAGGSYAFFRVDEGWGLAPEYDHIFAIYVTPPSGPTSKAECKKGGYKEFGFKNQGRCIAFVSRAAHGQ